MLQVEVTLQLLQCVTISCTPHSPLALAGADPQGAHSHLWLPIPACRRGLLHHALPLTCHSPCAYRKRCTRASACPPAGPSHRRSMPSPQHTSPPPARPPMCRRTPDPQRYNLFRVVVLRAQVLTTPHHEERDTQGLRPLARADQVPAPPPQDQAHASAQVSRGLLRDGQRRRRVPAVDHAP